MLTAGNAKIVILPEQEKMRGDLHLPSTAKQAPRGIVVSIGGIQEAGQEVPECLVGDIVYYGSYAEVWHGGKTYHVCEFYDILAFERLDKPATSK